MDGFDPEIKDFAKVRLLMWKNFIELMRRKYRLLFLILLPLLFFIILIQARRSFDVKVKGVYKFTAVDLQENFSNLMTLTRRRVDILSEHIQDFRGNVFAPNFVVAWAPGTRQAFLNIMGNAVRSLNGFEVKAMKNCRELKERFEADFFFVGVCFDETAFIKPNNKVYLMNDIYPNILNFSLVFPSEVRIYHDRYIGATWQTDRLFPMWSEKEQRIEADFDGGFVGYIREGFAHIQSKISESFIEVVSKGDEPVDENPPPAEPIPPAAADQRPKINLSRMTIMKHDFDPLHTVLYNVILLMTMIVYIFLGTNITCDIVREKQSGLKDLLITVGITNWIYYTARFLIDFVVVVLISLSFTVVLKITWNNGYAILTKVEMSSLFFILICYSLVTLSFFLLVAAFFDRLAYAVVLVPLIWIITYIPCFCMFNDDEITDAGVCFVSIFSNCVMSLIWHMIISRETYQEGLRWGLFLQTDAGNGKFSVALCLLIFLIQTIIHLCVALYMDKLNLGARISRSLNKTHLKNLLKSAKTERRKVSDDAFEGRRRGTYVYNIETGVKQTYITVNEMSKEYNNQFVLSNINLNLYEDEITVLMGHNGAGKTTLLNIISGIVTPSFGTVLYDRIDIHKVFYKVAARIGFSHQDNRLFPDLTLRDQLYFFGALRGLNKQECNSTVERYIDRLGLEDFSSTITAHLSCGMRHLTSICCALIGKNPVVLIDDFGNALDGYTRTLIWDLIIEEKYRRSILISTNSFETLKVLADRVVIISNGDVRCNGTTAFLKTIYDKGYRLMCIKAENCVTKYVTEFLSTYVPDIKPTSDIGKRITYVISYDYNDEIPIILLELESKIGDLFLESVAIDDRTMEDTFLTMLDEVPSEGDDNRCNEIMNGLSSYPDENDRPKFMHKYKTVKGVMLWFVQVGALIRKRYITGIGYKIFLILFFILPLISMFLPFILIPNLKKEKLPPLGFDFAPYKTAALIMGQRNMDDPTLTILPSYIMQTFKIFPQVQIIEVKSYNFNEVYMEYQKKDLIFANKAILGGIFIVDRTIVVFFNNFPYHTVPLMLNLIYDALARLYARTEIGLEIHLDPLDYHVERQLDDYQRSASRKVLLSLLTTLIYSVLYSMPAIHICIENRSKLKLIQIIAGARINTYWLSSLIFDTLKILITTAMLLLPIIIVDEPNLNEADILFYYWISVILYCIVFTAIAYLVGTLFRDPYSTFMLTALYHIGGVTLFFISLVFRSEYVVGGTSFLKMFNYIFPGYNFADILYELYYLGENKGMCSNKAVHAVSQYVEYCKIPPNCCEINSDTHAFPAIKTQFTIIMLHFFAPFIILLIYDYITIWGPPWLIKQPPPDDLTSSKVSHEINHSKAPYFNFDDAVMEDMRVRTLIPYMYNKKPLIVRNVGKKFINKLALKRVNFMIERHQIFGVLGTIASGKTTLIKVIIAQNRITYGCIYNNGIVLYSNLQKCYPLISYAPQIPLGLELFTPHELLSIFARLHGVPKRYISRYCDSLAKVLGFFSSYDKLLAHCSGGIKKRVSLAIALMGDVAIIYLDDPCFYLDPSGKRMLHNIMEKLRQNGNSILMTVYSVKETEGCCSRLAILINGNFWSVGSTLDLQGKFGLGYMLMLRVVSSMKKKKRKHLQLISRIESMFQGAAFKVRRSNCLYFFLSLKTNTLSTIFEEISNMMLTYYIIDFAISRCTMETIYGDHCEQYIYLKEHGII